MICILFSCGEKSYDTRNDASNDNGNLMQYTSYIDVTHYKSGYYVNVSNPWNEKSLGEYYLYPDSLDLPDELENKPVIRTPVKNVITYSSTQWSVFLELDEISRVKGILESDYTDNPEIKRLLAEKKIEDVGIETSLKTEIVINLHPDVILYTPYSTVPKTEISQAVSVLIRCYRSP